MDYGLKVRVYLRTSPEGEGAFIERQIRSTGAYFSPNEQWLILPVMYRNGELIRTECLPRENVLYVRYIIEGENNDG